MPIIRKCYSQRVLAPSVAIGIGLYTIGDDPDALETARIRTQNQRLLMQRLLYNKTAVPGAILEGSHFVLLTLNGEAAQKAVVRIPHIHDTAFAYALLTELAESYSPLLNKREEKVWFLTCCFKVGHQHIEALTAL